MSPFVIDFRELLRQAVERRASDVHLRAGCRPFLRVDGQLVETAFDVLDAAQAEAITREIVPVERTPVLEKLGECGFAHTVEAVGRFRVRVLYHRDGPALVLRPVPDAIPDLDALGLPPVARRLADEPRGLLLVTGPPGSGRTTTVAAIVDHINEAYPRHLVTIEDPVEFVHHPKRSIVTHREIGVDAPDARTALRGGMRHDPDVIVIGALDEPDMVRLALTAAAGHLVIGTLVSSGATEAVLRTVERFAPHEQRPVRAALAACLRGVVSQRLLERVDGKGRIPAVEVLVATSRVFDKIVNPDETRELEQLIIEGEYYGMQTFDQSLFSLHKNGMIGLRDALAAASHPHDLRIALQHAGFSLGTLDPVSSGSW